jgi:hypothetical protein
MVTLSTMDFMIENRNELLDTQMEVYRRGVTAADRPACCPAPYDQNNNWMREYNTAYVIPMGAGQRSAAEANRLVEWLFFNGIEVHELRADYTFDGQTFERGSYVVWLDQALRGLADTALNIGDDISASISQLYAPPGAWSHGYLWGADIVTIPDTAAFTPNTTEIHRTRPAEGGVESGRAEAYALELDSATAVRLLNSLTNDGVLGDVSLEPFAAQTGGMLPAGSVLFAADRATRVKLATAGRESGVLFRRIVSQAVPDDTEPIDHAPRIAVITGAVNQDVWSLRNLGFDANPVGTTTTINNAPTDPLVGYDVIWNTGNWPGTTLQTARDRFTAFFTGRRRLHRHRGKRWRELPERLRTGRRLCDRHLRRRLRRERHHPLGQHRRRDQPDRRPISGSGHGHRRSSHLVHQRAVDDVGGRQAPADELLRSGPVAAERGIGDGARLGPDCARHEHRRQRAPRLVLAESAVPRGSGAGVADGRRRGLLGGSVAAGNSRQGARGGENRPSLLAATSACPRRTPRGLTPRHGPAGRAAGSRVITPGRAPAAISGRSPRSLAVTLL